MDFILKWLLMASVQLAATMSPGPAFVVSVRNAMSYDRRAGVFTALGLSAGVGAHVFFVLAGLSLIIARSVYLYSAIKYAGAAYLIYIGVKSLRAKSRDVSVSGDTRSEIIIENRTLSSFGAFKIGLMTNLLNPKAVIFFTAVYTQFIDFHTPFFTHILYGLTSVIIEFLWFAGVAIVLTNPKIKKRFMSVVHWIERGCGGLMVALGVKLALSR